MENNNMTTTMCAAVLCVHDCSLLVCDCSTRQKVLVHTDQACCFSCGDYVRIEYSGDVYKRQGLGCAPFSGETAGIYSVSSGI